MEELMDSLTGLVAIICSLGIPVVIIICVFLRKMRRDKQQKEIRQLIIENKTDPETAKLLIEEPKKAKNVRQLGPVNLESLRTACILLGLGLGAFINWVLKDAGLHVETVYFWLIIAFGIGVGMLASFLVEMHLYKKQQAEHADEKEEK